MDATARSTYLIYHPSHGGSQHRVGGKTHIMLRKHSAGLLKCGG